MTYVLLYSVAFEMRVQTGRRVSHLHCHLGGMWNHIGDTLLGVCGRVFTEQGRPSLNMGGSIPLAGGSGLDKWGRSGWRDGPWVKKAYCSCRRAGFLPSTHME